MFNRTHASASPSVSLEKGITRLRPVQPGQIRPLRFNRHIGQSGSIRPTDAERKSATVLAALAFTILVAVCLTLYILNRNSRWAFSSLFISTHSQLRSLPLVLNDQTITPIPAPRVLNPNTRTHVTNPQDSSETYISYFPHSGFHNQRIALENALIISYILNRTLLLPPILLGEPPLRYRPSINLQVDVAMTSKVGLEHCAFVPEATYIPEECTDFWAHVHVPWKWLIDLSRLVTKRGMKILVREDLTDGFLLHLNLSPSETYFVHDNDAYEFRFYDSQSDNKPLGTRYQTRIDLPTLARLSRGHRLLQFGTLFGTTRIRLTDPIHIALRKDVRRAMLFDNPDLLAIADGIRDSPQLGGDWRYAAVHLRLGDGVFADSEARAQNVRLIWWKLLRELGLSDKDVAKIELHLKGVLMHPPIPVQDLASSRVPHPSSIIDQSAECSRDALHPLLGIPLFVATDKPSHHALWIFGRTFPCLYFLGDFGIHVAKLDNLTISSVNNSMMFTSEDFSPLTTPYHVPLAPLLSPFLDAIIASKARVVVGTPGSTFSRFVEDVLWRAYHDWDIVQRG